MHGARDSYCWLQRGVLQRTKRTKAGGGHHQPKKWDAAAVMAAGRPPADRVRGGRVQLVADVLIYNGPGAYTYTRPLYDHEIKESTIHQGHVESCHRQAAELSAAFYDRMDTVWAGGDDGRAAVACVLRER